MGLFNFIKKKNNGEKDTVRPVEEEKQGYYGNLEKTSLMTNLFEVAKENCDEAWNHEFLSHVAEASFACGNPQTIQGPDGFPYFQLETPVPNKHFQCYVISHMIPDYILERRICVVINAHKGQPDWYLTTAASLISPYGTSFTHRPPKYSFP